MKQLIWKCLPTEPCRCCSCTLIQIVEGLDYGAPTSCVHYLDYLSKFGEQILYDPSQWILMSEVLNDTDTKT